MIGLQQALVNILIEHQSTIGDVISNRYLVYFGDWWCETNPQKGVSIPTEFIDHGFLIIHMTSIFHYKPIILGYHFGIPLLAYPKTWPLHWAPVHRWNSVRTQRAKRPRKILTRRRNQKTGTTSSPVHWGHIFPYMVVSWGFHKWWIPKMDGLQWNIPWKLMI